MRRMTEISLLSYGIYLIHVLVLSSWREGRFGLTIAHDSFLSHPIDPWIGRAAPCVGVARSLRRDHRPDAPRAGAPSPRRLTRDDQRGPTAKAAFRCH